MVDKKDVKDRYSVETIATDFGKALQDNETGEQIPADEVLALILNKLNNIEKSVGWLEYFLDMDQRKL